jgi:two-component system chemotaxis response regulator CheB
MKKKIKILIVDDSAIIRQTLTEIYNSDPELEVINSASNPYIAVKKIKDETPDVISLDIEMPGMDGLTFLKKIMAQHPIPVVILSTLTEKGSDTAVQALRYGAIEVVAKPKIHTAKLLHESTITLCDAIKAAYHAKPREKTIHVEEEKPVQKKLSADVILQKRNVRSIKRTSDKVIAVGASTGGTKAVEEFLIEMPHNCPGIVIVQHMPELFTRSFAERLNSLCEIDVKEAEDGDLIVKGRALVSPGNQHMMVVKHGSHYRVKLVDGPLVNRHRPSVDVLFRSTAQSAGPNSTGIILTGMGDDGARGLLEMREARALTIAQDEDSCVVFGMPKEAIARGGAEFVLPLSEIAGKLITTQSFIDASQEKGLGQN